MNTLLFSSRRCYALFAVLACTLAFAAKAQTDPPGRIGRIALLTGTISLYNPSNGEAFNAPLNQPLTSGDVLTTTASSRSEIQIGSMTVRLDAGSTLRLLQIDDEQVRLYLDNGRVIAKLSSRETLGDFSLETHDGRFTARDTGIYRVDVDENSSSGTAYYGTLHLDSHDTAFDINAGQSARFRYPFQSHFSLTNAINDDFTRWSAVRDQQLAANTSTRYISPEMTGGADLDNYGTWSETPEYGPIWTPSAVAADWTPYRTGQWNWVEPWGWSWVGYEVWGFAPFHYGRWVQHHGAWGWVPGTRTARPAFAPAMVAWIGTPGRGAAPSVGRASPVGWFPLAPHEVYVPTYRSSERYLRRVNITHVSNIPNAAQIVSNPQAVVEQTHYMHRERPQAVTLVPANTFTQRSSFTPAPPAMPTTREQTPQHTGTPFTPQQIAPQAVPPANKPNGQDWRNHSNQPAGRLPDQPYSPRERVQVTPAITATPQVPAINVMPQRGERLAPEVPHTAPQPRIEAVVPRIQERPVQREARPEPASQPVRQAPPERLEPRINPPVPVQVLREVHQEAPRAVSRPPEQRPEAKPQHQEEHQRPVQNEQESRGPHRDEGGKH